MEIIPIINPITRKPDHERMVIRHITENIIGFVKYNIFLYAQDLDIISGIDLFINQNFYEKYLESVKYDSKYTNDGLIEIAIDMETLMGTSFRVPIKFNEI